jgi:transposase
MRRAYPSDISREQFEAIKPILEGATKKTHPRTYDLYDIFCAVLYIVKEGCTWRALPHDFPKWENVRYHYDIWAKQHFEDGRSIIDFIKEIAINVIRDDDGRLPETSMMVVDSKTIQNADTAETKGYDAGKKKTE